MKLDTSSTTTDGAVIVNRATTGDLDLDPRQLTVQGILYVNRCIGVLAVRLWSLGEERKM